MLMERVSLLVIEYENRKLSNDHRLKAKTRFATKIMLTYRASSSLMPYSSGHCLDHEDGSDKVVKDGHKTNLRHQPTSSAFVS